MSPHPAKVIAISTTKPNERARLRAVCANAVNMAIYMNAFRRDIL